VSRQCKISLGQPKFNLNQTPSWVPKANVWAIEIYGVVSIIINLVVIKKSFNHHTILITKLLVTKNF
jgi:hypothetical protein